MFDENGIKLTDKEILKGALDHMGEALCHLFETEEPIFQSVAFMLDSAIKLGTVIFNDGSILDASSNWEEYESELYEKRQLMRIIK